MAGDAPVHLVLGATGQVGWELARELAAVGSIVAPSRLELDLERPDSISNTIRSCRPTVIWNAAAATGVDALEDDPGLAFRMNATAPGVVADEARRVDATLVHFSTDYVFDGRKTTPYVETDSPNPLNVYGRSKLAGEHAVLAAGGRCVVLRTGWVYSARRKNFFRSIFAKGLGSEPLRVVDDQTGTPTWSGELARAARSLALALRQREAPEGLFHLAAGGTCSWFDFARSIRDGLVKRGVPWRAELSPISTARYAARANRPMWSVLSSEYFGRVVGYAMPEWDRSLDEFLTAIGAAWRP